jgi:transcriptional regulator GlxA family with amidase domain
MPRVALVVSDGVLANAVFELVDALSLANRYTERQYAEREILPPTIDIQLVSPSGDAVMAQNGRMLAVDGGLRSVRPDLIYVAPFALGTPDQLAARLKPLAPVCEWVTAAHADGVMLAASGSGVAVLARAGLLEDIVTPVAWWLETDLARLFPDLTLDPFLKVQAREDILLAGVHAAEPALALRILERIMSPDVATWVERLSGVERHPDGPDPALSYTPPVLRQDPLVTRAAHWLQLRFAQKPQLSELSDALAVHPRTLSRRFVASLGMTPVQYLQGLRMEAAKRMLARSDRKVDRVAYLVGYSDPGFFKNLFRKQTGLTPGEYRRQATSTPTSPLPVSSSERPALSDICPEANSSPSRGRRGPPRQ